MLPRCTEWYTGSAAAGRGGRAAVRSGRAGAWSRRAGGRPLFSSTAEYALRAMVHLATHRAPEGLRASQDIAAATKVPARYLSKIMKDLVEAGLVNSRRGPSGGFELAREAGAITVLEVVNAVDPIRRITTCPLGIPAHGTTLCRLHRRLDDTIAMVQQTLAAATIAEMTEPGRGAGGAKCFFPTIGGRPKRERRG